MKHLQRFQKQRKSISQPPLVNGGPKSTKLSEKPTRKRVEKRKSAEESEKERKRPKNVIKQEPGNVDQITRSRNELYSLFDEMHEPEDDVLEKPFIKYQQFITFLKVCCIFYLQGMVICAYTPRKIVRE